ncbi:hypothetical protein [Mesorhizobium sp.]|nr:hypothetical protein [Mesorhizobium sp.]RWP19697.1 MAG: hypothetical protein EOR02_34665 [Mesorhizobium sp.]RWP52938.1 MAG: hypothetical protein EOR07_34660 [Mesorhizobium sp.]TIM38859.1 MAG: hypothetical protein E5Y55_32545 [Mesorhizobium sp.]
MKTYNFDPAEFAKLEFLLAHTFSFLHEKRGRAELDQFRAKFLPIIRDVYYQVLGPKIDDRQYEAISEADPWDPELPPERAIELLAEIFKA